MKGASFLVFLAVATLFCILDAAPAGRKSDVRYLNSMPQFGKAKLSAMTPSTVVFEQVPQGFLTDYSKLDSKVWNFTTAYSTNMTAGSDSTDLDSDSFATIFTCQTAARKLKNKLIYDNSRSNSPKKALLRAVNLAQFDYTIRVTNDSTVLFPNVSYCSATAYKEVDPGDYDLDWAIVDDSKRGIEQRGGNGTGGPRFTKGNVYTMFVTPMGSVVVQDGKRKAKRSVKEIIGEDVPQNENVKEQKENGRGKKNVAAAAAAAVAEEKAEKEVASISKLKDKRRRNLKAVA